FTERTVVKLDTAQGAKRLAHWQGVAIAACEQCGRNRVPAIQLPMTLEAWLREPAAEDELRLLLDPASGTRIGALTESATVTLLIGPEGGLSPREREQAAESGFGAVRLGPRILRTETAGLAALTLLQGRFGDI